MPDIILKNILGQEVTYTGIDTVKLKNTAGGEETFSHGVAVENVPIELDLANGEQQTIYAPDGTLVKSAVVSITGGGGGDAVEMEETELPFVEGSGAYQTLLPITRLFLNATYTVMWNGTEYSCTCKAMEFADSLILTVGNAAFLGGEATGEPFLIAQLPDMVGCITTEANATNTVGLTLNFEAGGGGGTESIVKTACVIKDIDLTSTSVAASVSLMTSEDMIAQGLDPATIKDEGYNANSDYFVVATLTRLSTEMSSTNTTTFSAVTTSPIGIYNSRYTYALNFYANTSSYQAVAATTMSAQLPLSNGNSSYNNYGLYMSGGTLYMRKVKNHALAGKYLVTLSVVYLK